MSASGELYVDEVCRDTFSEELDKEFGEGKWRLDASSWYDCWDLSHLPDEIEIPIVDDEEEALGTLVVENEFYVDGDDTGRWVNVSPKSCRINKVRQ